MGRNTEIVIATSDEVPALPDTSMWLQQLSCTLAGLEAQATTVVNLIQHFFAPSTSQIIPTAAVLLHGPPGTGQLS